MITCGNGLVSWAEVFVPSGLQRTQVQTEDVTTHAISAENVEYVQLNVCAFYVLIIGWLFR